MPKHLIVNADDLGISVPTNLAIGRGVRRGILTSASLMTNMPAFGHAVDRIVRPNPKLGIGIHLCLTSGRSVALPERVPLLVGADGQFRHGFLGLLRLVNSKRRADALEQIEHELTAQVARADALAIEVDHLDSHQHVHMIPAIFPLVARLGKSRRATVRFSDERLAWRHLRRAALVRCVRNMGLAKKIVLSWFARGIRRNWPDAVSRVAYFGILDTGGIVPDVFRSIVAGLPQGASEVNVHPGLAAWLEDTLECSPADQRFLSRPQRAAELATVLDPALRAELLVGGVVLAKFRDVFPGVQASNVG